MLSIPITGLSHFCSGRCIKAVADGLLMRFQEFITLVKRASKEGANLALSQAVQLQEQLNKTEAYRRYGRSNIDHWLCKGLLISHSNRIDRIKLEALAASSNRIPYLQIADR